MCSDCLYSVRLGPDSIPSSDIRAGIAPFSLGAGSQRLLNPIPCFCLGESASGNLVGFATALVYT